MIDELTSMIPFKCEKFIFQGIEQQATGPPADF